MTLRTQLHCKLSGKVIGRLNIANSSSRRSREALISGSSFICKAAWKIEAWVWDNIKSDMKEIVLGVIDYINVTQVSNRSRVFVKTIMKIAAL